MHSRVFVQVIWGLFCFVRQIKVCWRETHMGCIGCTNKVYRHHWNLICYSTEHIFIWLMYQFISLQVLQDRKFLQPPPPIKFRFWLQIHWCLFWRKLLRMLHRSCRKKKSLFWWGTHHHIIISWFLIFKFRSKSVCWEKKYTPFLTSERKTLRKFCKTDSVYSVFFSV